MSVFDALWGGLFTIILLLSLTIFFKAVFFRYFYDAVALSTPQVLVDWRLWTIDIWFLLIGSTLVILIATLNIFARIIDNYLLRMRESDERSHRASMQRISP